MSDILAPIQMLGITPFVFYLHLLALIAAIAAALLGHVILWDLARPITEQQERLLGVFKRVVATALLALWVSGIWLVDKAATGAVTGNPKLQAKIIIAGILTANGIYMHRALFPRLTAGATFADFALRRQFVFAICGALSLVSWLWVSWLGITRAWNVHTSLKAILTLYAITLVLAELGAFYHVARHIVIDKAWSFDTPKQSVLVCIRPRQSKVAAPVTAQLERDEARTVEQVSERQKDKVRR